MANAAANSDEAAVSIDEALALAIRLHRSADFANAEILYRRVLAAAPGSADATHFLGVLLHQRDRSDEAIALIERSIQLDPDNAGRYNNLGNVFAERRRIDDSIRCFNRAVSLAPDHADAWSNLGSLLRARGRFDEAAEAFERAVAADPANVAAHTNYGNLLSARGRAKEAVEHYCRAIALVPGHAPSKRALGIAYYTLGEVQAAAEVYRRWLAEEPDNPVARHMLAACSGEAVPARAPDDYVARTFDEFAASFDQKLASLEYRAPQIVAEHVRQHVGEPQRKLDVLDAGCGTGLCGPLIRPYAARLVGVDLSKGMLEVARGQRVYDELIEAELGAYLSERVGQFDLIVSADTLVYFGDLALVLASAGAALRPEGWLVFTVEQLPEGEVAAGYRIEPHGRYSHSWSYVESMLSKAKFSKRSMAPVQLRMEAGKPVGGFVVVARI